jgi:hypothetical protein
VRHVIMTLDVINAHGLRNARLLIKVEHVTVEVGIIDDPPQVAFEMSVIDNVEPDQRAKQSPVGLHDSVPKQIATGREAFFHLVERIEQLLAGAFVGPLPRRESGAIHAVVDILVKKIRKPCLLVFDVLGKEIDSLVLCKLVEDRIKHRANVIFAIVNDFFRLFVPKHWNRDPAVEVWIGRELMLAQITE